MHDPNVEGTPVAAPEGQPEGRTTAPHRRERHTWRLVIGLTGLLGAAWVLAIATRYPNLLPG